MDAPADGGDIPSPVGLTERVELVLPVLWEEGEELDLVCNSIDILGTSHQVPPVPNHVLSFETCFGLYFPSSTEFVSKLVP